MPRLLCVSRKKLGQAHWLGSYTDVRAEEGESVGGFL